MDRPALLLLSLSLFACDGRALPASDSGPGASADFGAADKPNRPAVEAGARDAGTPDWTGPWGLGPCQPGQRMWCSNLVFSGWGLVDCDPATGFWKTVIRNGKLDLDCSEPLDGRRPATPCACYHLFYNPSCCERPDCILPGGTTGQLCPPSPGQLCDYCNPLNPECVASGAKCIVTNAHESFCAKDCADGSPCPAGYDCVEVPLKAGKTQQCVPLDFSCYY